MFLLAENLPRSCPLPSGALLSEGKWVAGPLATLRASFSTEASQQLASSRLARPS